MTQRRALSALFPAFVLTEAARAKAAPRSARHAAGREPLAADGVVKNKRGFARQKVIVNGRLAFSGRRFGETFERVGVCRRCDWDTPNLSERHL
jgi:hypothetical protein